jgi:hypothetical protein
LKRKIPFILVLIIVSIFVFSINALAASHDIDLSKDYYFNKNPAMYYYSQGNYFGIASWVSTEVSVPTNGSGYAYAQVHAGTLKNATESWQVLNGWVKTEAAWLYKSPATYTEHTADQWVGSNHIHLNDEYY